MVLTVAEVQKSSHSLWSHGEHEAGLRKAIVSIAFHDARDHDAALSCYQGPPVEVSSRGKTWVEGPHGGPNGLRSASIKGSDEGSSLWGLHSLTMEVEEQTSLRKPDHLVRRLQGLPRQHVYFLGVYV